MQQRRRRQRDFVDEAQDQAGPPACQGSCALLAWLFGVQRLVARQAGHVVESAASDEPGGGVFSRKSLRTGRPTSARAVEEHAAHHVLTIPQRLSNNAGS